jgi:hypothetical protein
MAIIKCHECAAEISSKAAACPKCGAAAKKKTSLFTWLVTIVIGIGVLGAVAGQKDVAKPQAQGPSDIEQALATTKLDYSWHKGGFETTMLASFKIANNGQVAIRDISIECDHFAKSGTRIDSNSGRIYDIVPAHGTKTFSEFNMGFIHSQANSTSCRITAVKI